MSNIIAATTGKRSMLSYLLSHRTYLLGLVHAVAFSTIYFLAYQLRFDFVIPSSSSAVLWETLRIVVVLKLVVFYFAGNYHGWWRYVTFADLIAILRASTLSLMIVAAVDYFLIDHLQIPRAVLLLDWVLTIVVLGGLRSSVRFSREHFWPLIRSANYSKTLFVGTDESEASLAMRIHSDLKLPFRIVGFVDDDVSKHGSRLGGIPILGATRDVIQIAAENDVQLVLVTAGRLSGNSMRDLVKVCERSRLKVKVLPAIEGLLSSNQKIQLRDVDINDLLRREPAQLDSVAIGELLKDRTVMVTGAGGSIGSEMCRQILKFQPRALVMVEKAENSLFFIERELRALRSTSVLNACIADILDHPRMSQIFAHHGPDVVFHAAAHKHVPLMEINVGEAIKNNVLGTKQLADLAHEFKVQSFVMISTDKAVNPTSVMGVTKHLAERYVHALSQESDTRFVSVRFGNVLGSAGSVVPIFQDQLRRGGPITITDARMTRYFMTIPEASQLVLQAGAMGRGGEIFVLNMGEPVKILDLANDLIQLSGLRPEDIEIEFTGMRAGEKLYEELYFCDEQTLETRHPKVRAAYHRPRELHEVAQEIQSLAELANGPYDSIICRLSELVPEYNPEVNRQNTAPQETAYKGHHVPLTHKAAEVLESECEEQPL